MGELAIKNDGRQDEYILDPLLGSHGFQEVFQHAQMIT
jgi:hypothetical protein